MGSGRNRLLLVVLVAVVAAIALWKSKRVVGPVEEIAVSGALVSQQETISNRSSSMLTPASLTQPSAEIAVQISETVKQNAVAGRMIFLDFRLGENGTVLTAASGASGRVKPVVHRTGPGWVDYQVFDAAGRQTLTGSVEDPTRRVLEHPGDVSASEISHTTILRPEGTLAIRLPGDSSPVRIVLSRQKVASSNTSAQREVLGDFVLRPQS